MWRNIREADGTLIVGGIDWDLEARIEAEGKPVFAARNFFAKSPQWLAEWVAHHRIRTLNVVGPVEAELAGVTCELLATMLARFDKSVERPEPAATCVFADGRAFYSATLWPTQRVWRWGMVSARWRPFPAWRHVQRLRRGRMARLDPLWAMMPPHIREFVVGHNETAFDELVACAELGEAAHDLARSGRRALLRLVARVYALKGPEAADGMRQMLGRRQRDILGGFGFPATESTVHILAKMSRGACTMPTIRAIRRLLCSDAAAVKILRQLPYVNTPVVTVLEDPWLRRVLSPRCLREMSRDWDDVLGCRPDSLMMCTIESLREIAARTGQRDAIGPIDSVAQMDRVAMELLSMPEENWPTPTTTLAGIAGLIEPLTTSAALEEEGRAMQHCVGSFQYQMTVGRVLLFRIQASERLGTGRATLELRPGADGQWHMSQLKGVRNGPVSEKTRQMVETWRTCAHNPIVAAI